MRIISRVLMLIMGFVFVAAAADTAMNEGHYPNEINMNIHNWSGKHWSKSLAIIKWSGPVTDAIDGTSMDVDYVRVYKRDESKQTNEK